MKYVRITKTWIVPLLAIAVAACNKERNGNASAPAEHRAETSYPDVRSHIRDAVKSPTKDTTVDHTLVTGDTLRLSEGTVTFYRKLLVRGKPVWSDGEEILPRGEQMVAALGRADTDGLSPARYNYDAAVKLTQILKSHPPDSLKYAYLADYDLLVTEGFNRYATDLTRGSIDPTKAGLDWKIPRAHPWEENLLRMAVKGTPPDSLIAMLRPQTPYYPRMMGALARHRAIKAKGGWPQVPAGKLVKDSASPTAAALRARLLASDDPKEVQLASVGQATPDVYDNDLKEALRHYQDRHAIEPDGALGKTTLGELNEDIDSRLSELQLNIDRWRWMPHDLGDMFVLVNVAGFELEVVENDVAIEHMNVVVGQTGWKTPLFQDTLEQIDVNPSWNVPESIMEAEVRPAIARNPNYLAEHNMVMTSDGTARQLPGGDNALGHYKFIFPNKDNIYLHDTPARSLFSRSQRAFSHGCIRLERPDDLAYLLASKATRATPQDIMNYRASGEEHWIKFKRTVPIYILYFTVWVDEDGTTHVYHDVYGHDRVLEEERAKAVAMN